MGCVVLGLTCSVGGVVQERDTQKMVDGKPDVDRMVGKMAGL